MAISWIVEGGCPVNPDALLREWVQLAPAVLHIPIVVITATGVVAGRPWYASSVESGTEQPTAPPDFDLDVTVEVEGRPGRAHVVVDKEIEDDGSTIEGSICSEVIAYRTQASAVFAFTGAVTLLQLSGGELSRPGLGRRYRAAEIPLLADGRDISRPTEGETALRSLASRLGCSELPAF